MKLYQLIDSKDALKKLNETEGLPFKVALRLSIDIRKIDDILEVYERKRRELINKYGKKDENGELLINNDQAVLTDKVAFSNEFSALVMEEVDLNMKTIKIDDLENSRGLTPGDISKISFLLEE